MINLSYSWGVGYGSLVSPVDVDVAASFWTVISFSNLCSSNNCWFFVFMSWSFLPCFFDYHLICQQLGDGACKIQFSTCLGSTHLDTLQDFDNGSLYFQGTFNHIPCFQNFPRQKKLTHTSSLKHLKI